MTELPATLVVGRDRTEETIANVRDPRQRAAVAKIVNCKKFDFACGNPFTEGVGSYTGVFFFLYYTKDGVMHGVKIGKTGRILLAVRNGRRVGLAP
jgi:hypothetical protein